MDETVVQVLREPGRAAEKKSFMWVMLGRDSDGRIGIIYEYDQSRSGDVADKLLKDFKGYLQTDGYKGYNKVGSDDDVIHVGCLAHIRRKFHKILNFKKIKKHKFKSACKALNYIGRIYYIENSLRNRKLSDKKFIQLRKERMRPVLDEFYKWLIVKQKEVPPRSSLGKAVNYALDEWEKFIRFLHSALLTPDNNLTENAIRPFVIGRKNWLFSNTPRGAKASSIMYSLIETAKANGLEPFKYLYYLFDNLPLAETEDALRKLLPYNIIPEKIEIK